MAIVSGVVIPDNKRIEIALTYIYGLGLSTSNLVLSSVMIDKNIRTKDLTEDQLVKIRKYIDDNCVVEADLRRKVSTDIKRLQEIGCYRGIRHRLGLPVRGQSTKCNARTRKGPRRAIVVKK